MPDLYDLARGIGYLTIKEVDEIKFVADLLPLNPVCANIGSGAGTSVLAVMLTRPDAVVYDVDITPDNGVAQMKEFGLYESPKWIRLTGDSKEVKLPVEVPLDYLFVDGDHSEAGLRGDLAAWLPRCKDGAYVLIHDYERDVWPDVARVSDDVMATHEFKGVMDTLAVYRKRGKS